MTDKELLEFYFSLPYDCHSTPQWPRNLIRKSMNGVVPDKIRHRRDKTGATIPNVVYRVVKEQIRIREYITSYSKTGYASSIIDLNAFLNYFEKVIETSTQKDNPKNPRTLINYLTLMIFFEMYESGELFGQ